MSYSFHVALFYITHLMLHYSYVKLFDVALFNVAVCDVALSDVAPFDAALFQCCTI